MAIEIVDFPMKNGDVPISFLYVYQRVYPQLLGPVVTGTLEKWVVNPIESPFNVITKSAKSHSGWWFIPPMTLWLCQNNYGKSPFDHGRYWASSRNRD